MKYHAMSFRLLTIILVVIVFSVYMSRTILADSSDNPEWHKYYLLGKFTGSDPHKPDKVFTFQYRTINGVVKSFTGSNSLITANVHGPQNSLLEIKFPRNYPYTNEPKNYPYTNNMPFLLINETDEIHDSGKTTDCFFTYSIPFSGETKVELIWLYLLSQNLYPNRGDDVPQYCILQTVAGNLAPLQQIRAGMSEQSVTCSSGLNLVFKTEDNSPACIKPDTSKILVERGWAKLVQ